MSGWVLRMAVHGMGSRNGLLLVALPFMACAYMRIIHAFIVITTDD